jgi:hypothetical protein
MLATLHLHWFRELPPWLYCLLLVSVFVAIAVGGQRAVRPLVRRWFRGKDYNETVGLYLSAYGVLYGITLGLISVAAWENFGDVEGKVSTEAAALASLYRSVDCYPEPARTELTGLLRDYTRQVIDVSWPEMHRGIVPRGAQPFSLRFQKRLLAFEPVTEGQIQLHRETLYRLAQMAEARRLRVDCVAWQLPTILWVVVLAGSFLSFVLTWLLVTEKPLLHDLLSTIMAILLGLLIYFLATLDLPFEGQHSVGPDSIELVYDTVMVTEGIAK